MKFLTILTLFSIFFNYGRAQSCSKSELDETYSDNDACEAEANLEFAKSIGNEDFQTILCKSITEKNKCLREILPRCLPEANVTRVELVILDRNAQKSLNNSELLGEDFLNNCPIFSTRLFRPFMLEVTGSDKCDYIEFTRVIAPAKRACDRSISKKLDTKLELSRFLSGAPRAQFIERAFCEAYTNWNEVCTAPYISQCHGPKGVQKLMEEDDEIYGEWEVDLRKNINPRFRFKTSCSGGSVGSPGGDDDFGVDDGFEFATATSVTTEEPLKFNDNRKKRSAYASEITARNAQEYFHEFL